MPIKFSAPETHIYFRVYVYENITYTIECITLVGNYHDYMFQQSRETGDSQNCNATQTSFSSKTSQTMKLHQVTRYSRIFHIKAYNQVRFTQVKPTTFLLSLCGKYCLLIFFCGPFIQEELSAEPKHLNSRIVAIMSST